MPTYKLHAPEASFRAFATLIAAEYNGVSVDVSTDLAAASKSPVGKLPLLELPDGNVIFSSHAMARFVAGLRRDTGLMGDTLAETAAVDAWMDWAAQDLELPSTVWFYPVAGYIPFNQAAYVRPSSLAFAVPCRPLARLLIPPAFPPLMRAGTRRPRRIWRPRWRCWTRTCWTRRTW
jgi:glutathione S-transferase